MLNEYKNGLLDVLKREGFDPEQFVAEEVGSAGFKLTFLDTPLWFLADNPTDSYEIFIISWTTFSPAFTQINHGGGPDTRMYKLFPQWLELHVRKYLDSLLVPNLWEQVETQKKLLSFDAVEQETGSYSDDEKAALRTSLRTARLLITERFSPSEDQVEIINERFDYLDQSLDRLRKRDWKPLLLSTIISISIALSLDTEAGAALLELFKQAFYQALYLLQ